MSHAQLEAVRPDERLVWVTSAVAVNPANILLVFHGRGGQIDVHFVGHTRQLAESDLTEAVNHPAGTTSTTTPGAGEVAAQPTETAAHTESAPSTEPEPPAKHQPEKTQTAA